MKLNRVFCIRLAIQCIKDICMYMSNMLMMLHVFLEMLMKIFCIVLIGFSSGSFLRRLFPSWGRQIVPVSVEVLESEIEELVAFSLSFDEWACHHMVDLLVFDGASSNDLSDYTEGVPQATVLVPSKTRRANEFLGRVNRIRQLANGIVNKEFANRVLDSFRYRESQKNEIVEMIPLVEASYDS